MEELLRLLRESMARHPKAGIQDAVKFIYQNEMGAEHLVKSGSDAAERVRAELSECGDNAEPLTEYLGGTLYRLSLPAVRGLLSAETIGGMFAATAAMAKGSVEGLKAKLGLVYELGFPEGEVTEYLERYATAGYPAVSHTAEYKASYSPSYRLVHRDFVTALEAFYAVDALLLTEKGKIIISIDGDCASGKSTLGRLMAGVYGGNLFCADDYFLPPEMRTAERLGEPGGNMHRERLKEEVIEPLLRGENPVIRRFSCHTGLLGEPESFPSRRVNIVEGSYSQHPLLAGAYDLRIAVRTSTENQLARIEAREGTASLEAFKTRWIPMEKKYFEHFDIFNRADVVVET